MQVPVCVRRFPEDSHVQSAPSLRVSLVSRKGRDPSLSSSMVNLMVGRTLLRWSSKGSTSSFSIMQHVSSTYRFQNLGLEGADCSASSSKNSMYKLATYYCRNKGAHGCTLPLLIELTVVAEVG